ncbi:MAG: hypothetical protein Q7R83_00320 [bacterium]|nr:hypothetical protein [bacterium]
MTQRAKEKACLSALFAGLFVLFAFLPSLGGHLFGSPDEVQYAEVAKQIAIDHRAFVPDAVVGAFPWLHPRSWVALGDRIAPVGFLGWPFVLSFFYHFGGTGILPWVGMLIVLSSAWPFFLLLRRFGFWPAWIGTLVAFTFPGIILFANRSLFPNLPLLALSVWMVWLLERFEHRFVKHWWMYGALAFAGTLILSFRPIEAVWILPWWVFAARHLRPKRNDWIAAAVGFLLVIGTLGWFANGAYGSWFGIGYGRGDQITARTAVVPVASAAAQASVGSSVWFLPYGLHPVTFVWNIFHYFGWLLLPWVLMIAGALYFFVKRHHWRVWHKGDARYVLLAAWTLVVLCVIYGSGSYVDRFGPRVATIANSFVRYFLPVGLFAGWAAATLSRDLMRVLRFRTFVIAGVVVLAFLGIIRGFTSDEGVIALRRELIRYAHIQTAASGWFKSGDLILSDRSDKVFFPAFHAVSPVPPLDLVRVFVRSGSSIGLFARPLTQEQKDTWRKAGLQVQELKGFGRETLYRVFTSS